MLNEHIATPIIDKARELNDSPIEHLNTVQEITGKLRAYLVHDIELKSEEIEKLVKQLTIYTSLIPVSIPLHLGIIFSRAVKYNEGDGKNCYEATSRLSYIPTNIGITPSKGRINQEGESLFYACLNADANSIGTILSEVRAAKGDVFNLMQCRTKLEKPKNQYDGGLHIAPIGISDYFRRSVPTPFKLHETYKDIYELYRNNTHPTSMLAMQLCDAFLTDILKKEESSRLYDITSVIGKECLKPDVLDGILYPSTRFEGFPNVALKTKAVDQKIRFETTLSILVEECYGYGMYKTTILDQGIVSGDSINWSNHKPETA